MKLRLCILIDSPGPDSQQSCKDQRPGETLLFEIFHDHRASFARLRDHPQHGIGAARAAMPTRQDYHRFSSPRQIP